MAASELSRIERKILLRAPRERVWKFLTNIEDFSKWFHVETAGTFTPGARLQVKSTNESCKGIEFCIVVERMEPPHTLSWRWHPEMPEPGVDYSREPATLVVFELSEVQGGTEVKVVESGFDRISLTRRARVFSENDKGWELMLASLEQYTHAAAQR
jgi:uncharacterized protein YndB with AHSA1/START domain